MSIAPFIGVHGIWVERRLYERFQSAIKQLRYENNQLQVEVKRLEADVKRLERMMEVLPARSLGS